MCSNNFRNFSGRDRRVPRQYSVFLFMRATALIYLLGFANASLQGQEKDLPNPFDFLADEAESTVAPSVEFLDRPAPPNPQSTAEKTIVAEVDVERLPAENEGESPSEPEALPAAEQAPVAVAAPQRDSVLETRFDKGLLIDVSGPIFGRFHWYLNNRLDLAQRQRVDLIIIRMTTEGGYLEEALQLGRRLRDIEWAKTIMFIPEEAISGGAIISLGCDRIYMQAGAVIGDAGPIQMGFDGQFNHAEEKLVSYTASVIRELAEAKNRPAALAEAMVDRSLTVYEAIEIATGRKAYLSKAELDTPEIAARFQVGPAVLEAGQNRFLTVGADRALELGLCEGVFVSEQELLGQLSISQLESTRINWVDKTVFLLNRPWLTALLLIAGLIGLYLELAAPGISVAGLASLVCFGIFFWSHALGGTAGWLEILLFLLGVSCLAFELFVLPGFGLFGVSGLALLVLSLVMASQDFVVPENASEWGQLRGNLLIVLGSVLGVLVLFFGQILLLDSIPGLNRFRLTAPEQITDATIDPSLTTLIQPTSGALCDVASGDQGIAESVLRPSGKVKIGGRLLDVITEGDYVEAGTLIEVLRVEGNRIIVRKSE